MHYFLGILVAPFVALALMIAWEQEDSDYPYSGFSPDCPDYEEVWYEYPGE